MVGAEMWLIDVNCFLSLLRCRIPLRLDDTARTEKLQVFIKEFRSVLGDKRRLVFDNKLPVLLASLIQYLGIFE